MQTENEIIRNFCPRCQMPSTFQRKAFACDNCLSEDLIPTPEDFIYLTEEEKQEIVGAIPLQALPASNIILDKEITNQLLTAKFAFLTGLAGTGKSTYLRELSKIRPNWMKLCSTTGIAAINAGGITINSALKYFNTKSLKQIWDNGKLHWNLRKIRENFQVLGIDEISMMNAESFGYIVDAIDEINNDTSGKFLGLIVIGDLAQLPTISTSKEPAELVIKSPFWSRFEENTIKLTKVWRQDNPDFLKAINLVRCGDGNNAVIALMDCGVSFTSVLDNDFQGTTLIPKNEGVDHFNNIRLNKIDSPIIRVTPTKRGKQLGEWEKNIPYELRLKIGAYVMILANDSITQNWDFVNGDTGTIVEYDDSKYDKEVFRVKLKRNNEIVTVGRVLRENRTDGEPDQTHFSSMFHPYVDQMTSEWILGTIKYHPLRLAYASTIHKSQGLSLDALQIDSRETFFGSPNMAYVAISRCKTPEGLVIVGNPKGIASKIRVNKDVLKYV